MTEIGRRSSQREVELLGDLAISASAAGRLRDTPLRGCERIRATERGALLVDLDEVFAAPRDGQCHSTDVLQLAGPARRPGTSPAGSCDPRSHIPINRTSLRLAACRRHLRGYSALDRFADLGRGCAQVPDYPVRQCQRQRNDLAIDEFGTVDRRRAGKVLLRRSVRELGLEVRARVLALVVRESVAYARVQDLIPARQLG